MSQLLSTDEFAVGRVVQLVDSSGNAHRFVVVASGGGGGGITQLTGDVVAGPGSGSQVTRVEVLSGAGAGAAVQVDTKHQHGGGALDIGTDGTTLATFVDAGGPVVIGGTHATSVTIGESAACTATAVDAPAGTSTVQLATVTDHLIVGGTGPTIPTQVRMPSIQGAGGGALTVDGTTGVVSGNGVHETVIDQAFGISVPNGPGVHLGGPYIIPPNATVRVELFCSDLTPDETMGYVIATDTVSANFEQTGAGFQLQVANRSGIGARTVNYRVFQTVPA